MSEKILVVDDELTMRNLLVDVLTNEEFIVNIASTAEEGLKKIEDDSYSLLITDIKMPGMTGIDMIKKIREYDEDICIIVITAYATADTAVEAMRHGVYDYIKKPFNIDDIVTTVNRALENRNLKIENRRLLKDLERSNRELQKHKEILEKEVMATGQELSMKKLEVETLSKVGQALGSVLDVDEIIDLVLRSSIDQTRTDTGMVILKDEDSENLSIKNSVGIFKDIVNSIENDLFIKKVVNDRIPILLDDNTDAQLRNICPQLKSLLSVPLKVKDKFLGSIVIGSKSRVFTNDDVKLVTTLANQSAITIDNIRLYKGIQKVYFATIRALVSVIEAKDAYTRGHSERVTEYAVKIAKSMNLPKEEIEIIESAGYLHDLGKVGVSGKVIRKAGKLTDEEYEDIKKHPALGAKIIEPIEFLGSVRDIIKHHHEWFNGNGYPDRLKGYEICLGARILSVADAYDALTSTRSYHMSSTPEEAAKELRRSAGTQFDPEIVEVFLKVMGLDNVK